MGVVPWEIYHSIYNFLFHIRFYRESFADHFSIKKNFELNENFISQNPLKMTFLCLKCYAS